MIDIYNKLNFKMKNQSSDSASGQFLQQTDENSPILESNVLVK